MFRKIMVLVLALLLCCTAVMAEEIHVYDKKQGGYSYVSFGTFPLTAVGEEAPILWRVLDVQENEAYLLAEYIIDVHYVHLDTKAYYSLTWEDSDLYAYLQNDFMPRAFSEEEQAALLQRTEDGAMVTLPQIDDIRNKAYGFADNKSRLCKGTEYAKSIGLFLYSDKNSPWLSRNKSKDRPQQQRRVMDDGKLGTVPCGNVDLGIRPCVYVDLSLLSITGGTGVKDDPFQLAPAGVPMPVQPEETPAQTVENTETAQITETVETTETIAEVQPTPKPTVTPYQPDEAARDDLSSLISEYMKNKGNATVAPITVVTIDTPVIGITTFEDEDGTVITYNPEEEPAQEEAPVTVQPEEEPAQEEAPVTVQPEEQPTQAEPLVVLDFSFEPTITLPAVTVETPAQEPTEVTVAPAEPPAEITEIPVEEPAEEPVEEPAEVEAPAEEPAQEPADEPLPVEEEIIDGFLAGSDPAYIHTSFPKLTKAGFLPTGESEFVLTDEENGLWLYASQTLRIQIERKTGTNAKKQPLRWYEARIFTKDASEMFDFFPLDEANYKNHYKLAYADEIAKKHHLVFGINSDYFIYRVARQNDKDVNYEYPKGMIIRDQEIFYDSPRKATSTVYPPLDVMAFYPDGSMQVYLNGTMTAKEMLSGGAVDTLSFGPILVEDGEISPRSKEFGSTPNPRTAIGMVEPGHYVCLLVESRISESKGESCVWMAEMMEALGCETALNLDGGATSTMIFMGKQVNKSGNYGDITNRKQNELIGIGFSENVGE